MVVSSCPFCNTDAKKVLLSSRNTMAFLDGFPVTEGHSLVVPKRHIASIFELPEAEQAEVWAVVAKVRALLEKQYSPDGFNIGVNDGPAAGQTIQHAHVHIIPRRKGDIADPKGGIRWIMADKAKYW
jgi:diadenosine tetraphosphate (Ap4A) HIT family hydrolase